MPDRNVRQEAHGLFARFAGTFGITAVGAALAFLSQLAAARLLGADEYGSYAYALSWITLLSVLGSLGLPSAIVRFVPAYCARGQQDSAAAIVRFADKFLMPVGIVCVVAAAITWLMADHGSGRDRAVALALAVVPLAVAVKLRAATLRTYDRSVQSVAVETPLREFVLCVCFISCAFAGLSLDSLQAMGATGIAIAASAVVGSAWLPRHCYSASSDKLSATEKSAILRTALSLLAVSGGYLALKRLDVILVANLVGTRDAGMYSIALRMADVLQLPLTAATVLMAPRISHAFSIGDQIGLQRNAALASLYSVVLCSAAALPMIAVPEFFLGLFGSEFTAAAPLVRIMALAQIVAATAGTVNLLLTMTGNERAVVRVVAFLGVSHLLMSAVLLGTWGVVGGAVANLISTIGVNVVLSLRVRRSLGLRPGFLYFLRAHWDKKFN